MKASEANWGSIQFFDPSEFPQGTLEHMDFRVIEVLNRLRIAVGGSLFPSPVFGAHVRHQGNSRHSTQEMSRLVDATDFFVSQGLAQRAYREALKIPEIGGLGVYTDMMFRGQQWPMMHIDLRPERMLWVGVGRPLTYIYEHRNWERYYKKLAEAWRG